MTSDSPAPELEEAQSDRVRVEAYMLLASLLRDPPPSELLAALRAIEPPSSEANRMSPLASAWQALAAAAQEVDPSSLESAHFNLFIGVGRADLLPYASWYISGALMDQPLAALRADLARLGLERAAGVAEPEDHAAAICETMALLAEPEQGGTFDAQKMFFLTHVKDWLPLFFKDLGQSERCAFYAAVGRFGQAFIEFEKTWLELPE